MILRVLPNGDVVAVAHADLDADMLAALGHVQAVRRGGHVVPAGRVKRGAFRLIRRTFAESPRVAAWTRTWRGPWLADLRASGGPVLGPFAERDRAIAAEEAWLARRYLGEPSPGKEAAA